MKPRTMMACLLFILFTVFVLGGLALAQEVAPSSSSSGSEGISNFLGTAREGAIACRATPVHLGRTTQVWDARVTVEGGDKLIALFRCTQMVLWQNPKP